MQNKLILGTVQFGLDYGVNNTSGQPSFSEVKQILDCAYESGIRTLDTAEAYGTSQEVIGNYHKQSKNRFRIVSKLAAHKTATISFRESVEEDIERLGVQCLYAFMYHNFDSYKKRIAKDRIEIKQLLSEGLIHKFGVSLYTNEELEEVLRDDMVTIVQLPFNLLDNHSVRGELLETAKQKGIEIHTRSSFLQGLFFKNREDIRGELSGILPDLVEIHNLCTHYKTSVLDTALNYPLSKEYIDQVLIGVETVEQLRSNLESAHKGMNKNLYQDIDKIKVQDKLLLNPSNW